MKRLALLALLLLLAAACQPVPASPLTPETLTPIPAGALNLPSATALTADAAPTIAPAVTADVLTPPTPATVNPLTGLPVADPQLLERRPVLVKIQNVPRESRPQWGLSKADIVYEYYIEYGDTRLAALYYGNNADMIGPIRSARHIDQHIIQSTAAIFVFGGAYQELYTLLSESSFGDRLVREGPNTYPALFRYEPQGDNFLMLNMAALPEIIEFYQIDNARPNLEGMTFSKTPPPGGVPAAQIFVRFSGGMYNRWDYNPADGSYLRYADAQNDIERTNPVYDLLTDRLSGEPIQADNVVVLLAEYESLRDDAEVYDVGLDHPDGGTAYAARGGLIYTLKWQRQADNGLLILVDANGAPFPLKPGQTWFEVVGLASDVSSEKNAWRFTFRQP
jgi:hypothetical protein